MALPGQVVHYEDYSNSKMVHTCPFSFAGCDFQSHQVNAVQKHIKDDPNRHLTFLCDCLKDISGNVRRFQHNYETYEMKMNNNEKRCLQMANAAGGSHLLWKIDNYNEKYFAAKTGAKVNIFSNPFVVGRYGYKMVLLAALYGDGKARGKFMSVFISIIRGEYDAILPWPFHHKITLSLLDQCENPEERKNVQFVIKPNIRMENKCFLARPDQDRNASFGAQNFLELDAINQFTYIKDDTIFIGVQVDTTDLNNFI